MQLPVLKTDLLPLMLMQTKWAAILNPFLGNPSLNSVILPSVTLAIGSNVINHTLQRKLTGWTVVRQRAAASIYDTQDSNSMPDLTLLLTSDAAVVVDLEVF